MGTTTKIEWTDATWNPITGCTKVSEGCRNCYIARTLPRHGQDPWEVQLHPERLEIPLHWKKPRRIFISLTDLFHDDIPEDFIDRVFAIAARCRRHTFQILTKRPARLLHYMDPKRKDDVNLRWTRHMPNIGDRDLAEWEAEFKQGFLNNVWLGVSVEDQKTAEQRIPILLQAPAAVRFVSYEPALGPVDFGPSLSHMTWDEMIEHQNETGHTDCESVRVDWIIAGGESGPGARPMHPDWARSARDQCQAARVPFFFKQWGEWAPTETDDKDSLHFSSASPTHRVIGGQLMKRVGKRAAGRLLDGREWNEMPNPVPA